MRRADAVAALFLALAAAGQGQAARAQEGEAAAPVASPNPLSGLDIEALSATRTLPLFTPSRSVPVVEEYVEPEPEPVAMPVVEEAQPVPPALRLVGVIRTTSEEVALFSDENTGEIRRIRPEEDYEGWTLRIVDGRTVEFRNEDLRHTLSMFEPGSNPPAMAQPAIPEFGEGHAFDVPTTDPNMMGGDIDYGGEFAVDGDGNPILDGDGNPVEASPDGMDGGSEDYENPEYYEDTPEDIPPDGGDQSEF